MPRRPGVRTERGARPVLHKIAQQIAELRRAPSGIDRDRLGRGTRTETAGGAGEPRRAPPQAVGPFNVVPGESTGGGYEIRTREGLPPTRFPTVRMAVRGCSRVFARQVRPGGRTGANGGVRQRTGQRSGQRVGRPSRDLGALSCRRPQHIGTGWTRIDAYTEPISVAPIAGKRPLTCRGCVTRAQSASDGSVRSTSLSVSPADVRTPLLATITRLASCVTLGH